MKRKQTTGATLSSDNRSDTPASPKTQTGKMYVGPIFDYMVIGGGLSLVVCVGIWLFLGRGPVEDVRYPIFFGSMLLLSNYAHFAASTVRLYTKPNAFDMAPFLTMVFPAITIGVLVLGILFADVLGYHLTRLYSTWATYHFAAQAYGIAMIYLYRSGCQISASQKKMLWYACMATFLQTLIAEPKQKLGVWWILPTSSLETVPAATIAFNAAVWIASLLAVIVPIVVFARLMVRDRVRIPGIVILVIMTNVAWFTIFPLMKAVALTNIFHGIQYLAIVTIFHVKDQAVRPGNRHGTLWHASVFNIMCIVLGYALFRLWPESFVIAGLGYIESALVVTAIVNLHHFIVDGFIWRLKSDPNARIVGAA